MGNNVFLASVGRAEAFQKVGGDWKHFFSAKTLTDSSINISVSAEEIRGGEGGQLLGQYFHSSVFGLAMTDTMFHLDYIAAQVGATIENGGYDLKEEAVTLTDGKLTLSGVPISMVVGGDIIVWYRKVGTADYMSKTFAKGTSTFEITVADLDGEKFCVSYFADEAAARTVIISANFVPKEFMVLLTTKLFTGDANAPDTGTHAGSVTVKIPRFQLNGTMDLAMAMTSAATSQLQGQALAYEEDCGSPRYAEIVEYIKASESPLGYSKLIADGDYVKAGETPRIYAVKLGKKPIFVPNDNITFAPVLTSGKWAAAGSNTFTIKAGKEGAGLTGTVTVKAAT